MKLAIASSLLLTALTSCNQWVRPTPPSPERRDHDQQAALAVMVESSCSPFSGGGSRRFGSGVIVSDWQVLTALHVAECGSAIANIHVTTADGQRYRFSPEKEWQSEDIARIQMSSASSMRGPIKPPTVRDDSMTIYDPVYIHTALPTRSKIVGEATGYSYSGNQYYSGARFSYRAETQGGNSGSGVYDIEGRLVGIHISRADEAGVGYAAIVTEDMIPR